MTSGKKVIVGRMPKKQLMTMVFKNLTERLSKEISEEIFDEMVSNGEYEEILEIVKHSIKNDDE